MAFHWGGVVAIVIFYVMILAVGLWASRKGQEIPDSEDVMLAGRNIGLIVGIFTMTATWVGGGYINGAAEYTYSSGLLWCQAPVGYCLSLIVGGALFANKMRTAGYVTMLDPLQRKYGMRMGGLCFLPALMGETFWSAAILSALGATLSVLLDLDIYLSIISSSAIAVFYTLFGGLYSVAYTDVVQLICIFIGLWLCIPFAYFNPYAYVRSADHAPTDWIGTVPAADWGMWCDTGLMLVFGGIPWQVYFQRVLSSRDARRAQLLSYVAGVGCLIMAVPPMIIGGIAKNTNWTSVPTYGKEIPPEERQLVLPLVLQHLAPDFISYVGLGAISAAVMSSADSSILGGASMFARNIYKLIIRQKASETEIIWVMRAAIVIIGAMATVMGLTVRSVYGLWFLCSDLVYVILFPQLVCVLYYKNSNTYGAAAGYLCGLTLRVLGGETIIGLPPIILYPGWREPDLAAGEVYRVQRFPFRTFAMLVTLTFIIVFSELTKYLFETGKIPAKLDVFRAVVLKPDEQQRIKEAEELHALEYEVIPIVKPFTGSIKRRKSSLYRSATIDRSTLGVDGRGTSIAMSNRQATLNGDEDGEYVGRLSRAQLLKGVSLDTADSVEASRNGSTTNTTNTSNITAIKQPLLQHHQQQPFPDVIVEEPTVTSSRSGSIVKRSGEIDNSPTMF